MGWSARPHGLGMHLHEVLGIQYEIGRHPQDCTSNSVMMVGLRMI